MDQKFFSSTTEDVDLFIKILANLHGISQNCTHFVGSNETNNRPDGQQIRHTIFPDQSYSTIFVERMWLYATVQL